MQPHDTTLCAICEQPFTPKGHGAKYCSQRCRSRADGTRVKGICEICSAEYGASVTDARNGRRRTCSKSCGNVLKRREAQRRIEQHYEMPIKTILQYFYIAKRMSVRQLCAMFQSGNHAILDWLKECDIPIRKGSKAVATQWESNNKRRKKQARRMARQSREWHEKNHDNLPVKRPEIRAKISAAKMGEKNAMWHLTGPKHFAWKGGKVQYRGAHWRSIRSAILRRDDYTCQICLERFDRLFLDVHHIVPYRLTQDNRPENLITLCKPCHGTLKVH